MAALRKTSIVFAALLSALVLRERLGPLHLAATLLVCAGAVALQLT